MRKTSLEGVVENLGIFAFGMGSAIERKLGGSPSVVGVVHFLLRAD